MCIRDSIRYRLSQVLAELTTTNKNRSVHPALPARIPLELFYKCKNLPHVLLQKNALVPPEKGGAQSHHAVVDRDVRIDTLRVVIPLAVQGEGVHADTDDLDVVLILVLAASTAIKRPRK